MANIFDIEDWIVIAAEAPARNFKKNDIVIYNDNYYYALVDHTLDAGNPPSISSSQWGGMAQDANGEIKPIFIWIPSYNSRINYNPKVIRNQFGDGYVQRIADGINNTLMMFNVSFRNRDFNEMKAISHFLYVRQGYESFLYYPPPPFNKLKRFTCADFGPSFEFYNNSSIDTVFQEEVY